MTEPIGYKLNPEKLKRAPQDILPYVVGAFYYTEDYEYFDVIKPYLDIPVKSKSLEELSQELNEKIDELIENTKRKFYASKIFAESRYEKKFDKIFDNFEYARKNGIFPLKYGIWTTYPIMGNSGPQWTTNFFNLSFSENSVGFWSIQPNLRVYLEKKPNMIVRFFSKLLLNFEWVNKK